MNPRSLTAPDARLTARVVLAIVVVSLALFVLFASGPATSFSVAQQATTSGASTIQFMNPDNDTSTEVTAVDDGVDTAYHLVAWVGNMPPNPTVSFRFRRSGEQEQTIGAGTQVGDDTFELKWSTLPADGSYTLRVILFSGGTQVAEDTQAIVVNQTPPPNPPTPTDNDTPNAVEIVYPANGEEVGFFTAAGDTNAEIDVEASADTDTVTVYYTTSSPGTDPTWEECGADDHPDDTGDGVTCTLVGDDTAEQVRGIAAVAGDTNPVGLADVDSADAHRANGYSQVPSSITLTPVTQSVGLVAGSTNFPCSNFIVANAFDQKGRRVVRAQVDVHAAGPLDRLAFDDPGTTETDSSPHKAPDVAHTNEPEADCEGTPTNFNSASQQGEHEVNGEGDIKHIESTTGTDTQGRFRFRMASGGSGVTQITAWLDNDGNDLHCAEEPSSNASISWGTADATPTGLGADQATCPRPTGTASPTPSASTSTASPSPSTSTASPTATETTGPALQRARTDIRRFRYARRAFKGIVSSLASQCERNRPVLIKKVRRGPDRTIARRLSDGRGRFSAVKRRVRGRFYAVAPPRTIETPTVITQCERGRSNTIRVRRR